MPTPDSVRQAKESIADMLNMHESKAHWCIDRPRIKALTTALQIMDLYAIEGLAHLEDDERIKMLEAELARYETALEKICDHFHKAILDNKYNPIWVIANQALGQKEII